MIRPHNPSGTFLEVVIERRGLIAQRVLINGVEVPSVRRIETLDDASDAPQVSITLYARVTYRELDVEDARPSVVAGQLPLDEDMQVHADYHAELQAEGKP